jgi:hypothetical protein
MSKLRELIEKGPKLCGSIKHDHWSYIFLHAFDKEVSDKASVFAHKDGESIESRFEILNALHMAGGVERPKVEYWISLLKLCAYSYAVHKGNVELEHRRNKLAGLLSTEEGDNLEIASVMSVQEASTLTFWD